MHQMLTQEPWCFHPEQIATLTDWQIEHQYAKPAMERARRLEEEREKWKNPSGLPQDPRSALHDDDAAVGLEDERPKHPPVGTPEFRDWIINQFMVMGIPYQDAVRMYEEQKNDPIPPPPPGGWDKV